MTANQESTGPLAGITVCDFTHGVAGPYTSMLLADLGADVWKIEKPSRGDATRYMNMTDKFRKAIPKSGGDYFLAINRNKRSVALDLQTARGKEIALDLAASADIVISNFRPGVMERLDLDYATVKARNERVIYATLTAYGQTGPLAHQPGMDVAVQARSGVMSITGYGGMEPVKPGVSLADFSGGSHLATAVLAALYRREKTGEGESLTISLLDATMLMLINYSVAVLDGGSTIAPMGSGHPQLVPFQAFKASDGYVVIATGTNRLFVDLCRVLGVEELAQDPRFVANTDRVANREALIEILTEHTSKKSVSEWLSIFEEHEIPCAPVNSMEQALNDPQLIANDMVHLVKHPEFGDLHLLGSPYRFEHSTFSISRPPPQLGEHTSEILTNNLALAETDIAELREQGVIG